MPPKGKKKASQPLSQPDVPDWVDEPGVESLTNDQFNFLISHPKSAPGILKLLREKGNLPPYFPPSSPSRAPAPMVSSQAEPPASRRSLFDQFERSPLPQSSIFGTIEGSILGKRPQPPSPGPAASMQTDSPTRVQVPPPDSALVAPVVDWGNYFNNLENALSALRIDHEHTPRYLGTMLTGLQTLLRDECVLSLWIDSGFTIADLLDALPRSGRVASAIPTPGPGNTPVPKPHVKRVRINLPQPPTVPKTSAPAKADSAPPALDKRPPPSEAPAVSRIAPKRPA
jgi:hypothetical protein